ncbi:MAG: DciA family protein [Gammaproteobacteria bacterium]
MTRAGPHSIADLLSRGELRSLTDEARQRESLTSRIRSRLPADEAAHLVSAGLNETGKLTLLMDSPVWAARVRFRAEELGAKKLVVRVSPPGDQSGSPGTS